MLASARASASAAARLGEFGLDLATSLTNLAELVQEVFAPGSKDVALTGQFIGNSDRSVFSFTCLGELGAKRLHFLGERLELRGNNRQFGCHGRCRIRCWAGRLRGSRRGVSGTSSYRRIVSSLEEAARKRFNDRVECGPPGTRSRLK